MPNAPLPNVTQEKPRAVARGFGVSAIPFWWLVAALATVADRVLKSLAWSGAELDLGFAWARFRLFRNGGIAFSLPLSGFLYWLLAVPLLLALGFGLLNSWRTKRLLPALAFGLILLGALSNGYDRLAHGFVVDYLIFFSVSAVNIADALIIGGVLLLVFGPRDAH